MNTEVQTPAEMAASIMQGYAAYIESEQRRTRGGGRRYYVYASAWRACTRQMALELYESDKLPDWSVDTLANFRRGRDRERDLLADFTRAGRLADPSFEVVGREQRFELKDHKDRVVIVGKVDAQLKNRQMSAPMEVKSWSVNLTNRVEKFDDLFHSRWTRAGAHQLLAYMYATNQPVGFMLLDRNGLPLLLEVELVKHLDRMEDFLHRAEIAMDAADNQDREHDLERFLPPYINDADECKHCGFYGSVCNPPSLTPGAQLIVDETVVQMVERYAELQPLGEEYEALDKQVKKKFRGIDLAIVGKVLVEGKWQRDTKYDIPEEVKTQIENLKAPYGKAIAKGKFFLTLTRI